MNLLSRRVTAIGKCGNYEIFRLSLVVKLYNYTVLLHVW